MFESGSCCRVKDVDFGWVSWVEFFERVMLLGLLCRWFSRSPISRVFPLWDGWSQVCLRAHWLPLTTNCWLIKVETRRSEPPCRRVINPNWSLKNWDAFVLSCGAEQRWHAHCHLSSLTRHDSLRELGRLSSLSIP